MVYQFPEAARFDRVVPKTKIYTHSRVSATVKKIFIREIDKIIWSYKLSPETVNLPAKNGVDEIQIFTIVLKNGNLKHDLLAAIDKAIPSPIIFILSFKDKIKYAAAYKRRSEADKSKWVISSYFETEWIPEDAELASLPMVLDLNSLYQHFMKNIIPFPSGDDESMEEFMDRLEQIAKLKREIEKLDNKLQKTKQFNRRVEINSELKKLRKKTDGLQK